MKKMVEDGVIETRPLVEILMQLIRKAEFGS